MTDEIIVAIIRTGITHVYDIFRSGIPKIVASVFDGNGDMAEAIFDSDLLLGTRQKFTIFNYQTLLIGNKLQVLETKEVVTI